MCTAVLSLTSRGGVRLGANTAFGFAGSKTFSFILPPCARIGGPCVGNTDVGAIFGQSSLDASISRHLLPMFALEKSPLTHHGGIRPFTQRVAMTLFPSSKN